MFAYGGTARIVSLVPALLLAVGIAVGGIGLAVVGEETAVPEGAIRSTGVGAAEAMDLSAEKNANSSAGLTIAGSAVMYACGVAAIVLNIVGNVHIKQGGELMRRVQIKGNGISVSF
jgi:hypothetical protein